MDPTVSHVSATSIETKSVSIEQTYDSLTQAKSLKRTLKKQTEHIKKTSNNWNSFKTTIEIYIWNSSPKDGDNETKTVNHKSKLIGPIHSAQLHFDKNIPKNSL